MKLKVVLPAFNEARSLESLLPDILSHLGDTGLLYEVCVIDDGSTDDTAAVTYDFCQDAPVRLLTHVKNRGLGRALMTAFQALAPECEADDVICTLDADDTHSPLLLDQLAEKVSEGFDVVIASRFAAGGQVVGLSLFRRALSRAAARLLSAAYPAQGVKDYTSGFRAYRASVILNALERYGERLITRSDFSCNAELLIKLLSLGARPAEIPLRLRYDKKRGKSKLRLLKTLRGYMLLMARSGRLRTR
ncbi:MAG: glycosyltransferase family 2 protein [Candidatus Coatesbacteria bacterium]|nr:glycosyltransferase family 2 protein [Candidatus Coatesbacteria bacterium]